jgi:hypothetical protein
VIDALANGSDWERPLEFELLELGLLHFEENKQSGMEFARVRPLRATITGIEQ